MSATEGNVARVRPGVAERVSLEDVSFCRASERSAPSVGDEGSARFTVFAATAVVLGSVLWWLASWALSFTGGAAPVVLIVVVAALCFVVPIVAVSAAGYSTPRRWMKVPKWADPARRIHVCCPPDALAEFGPIEDEDFEPEFVRIVLVAPKGWRDGLIYTFAALAALPVASAAKVALGVAVPPFFAMQVGFLAGMVIIATIRQTYLRISPGQVEVLQFTAWKPAADSCRGFDLRTSRLVIDPRRRRLVVAATGEEPSVKAPATVVSFLGVFQPRRVAHGLVRAAISTAPTPELPADRLHD